MDTSSGSHGHVTIRLDERGFPILVCPWIKTGKEAAGGTCDGQLQFVSYHSILCLVKGRKYALPVGCNASHPKVVILKWNGPSLKPRNSQVSGVNRGNNSDQTPRVCIGPRQHYPYIPYSSLKFLYWSAGTRCFTFFLQKTRRLAFRLETGPRKR